MILFIKQARIVQKNSPLNGLVNDILIENGTISKIAPKLDIPAGAKVIEENGLHVSTGWFDLIASQKDPGLEHKEDVLTFNKAALAGGYTSVAVMPDTQPVSHGKVEIEYTLSKTKNLPVSILPIGALSVNSEGKDMAELFDMHQSGAVAFSDGKKPLLNAGLLVRCLQYCAPFNATIITYSDEKSLSQGGKVNEGINSTRLGLKGRPKLAEELMVQRDIALLEYAGGNLHFGTLSSPVAIQMKEEGRKKGLNLSCSVAAHHLYFSDNSLESFDSNFKVLPPLRTENDRKELLELINSNAIEVLVSDHSPEDVESKHKEFDLAEFGAIGLETCFAAARYATQSHTTLDVLIEMLTDNPRKVLQLQAVKIEVGAKAELTLFNPDTEWTFGLSDIRSKSKNSPFIGKPLKGKALGIINKGQYFKA